MTFKTTLTFSFLLFALFSLAQPFQSISLHSDIDHVQPMTGIVFWQDNSGDLTTLGDKCQLEFAYLIYSDVIEQEGVYDWTDVDNLLATAAGHERQVILRFRYTYPGETKRSVPLYITEEAGYTEQLMNVEGSSTYIPDWSSSTLEDFTLDFYTAFAARYDNDPRLAFVQVGFGSYAEYHLWSGPFTLGQTFPTKDFQANFLTHLDTTFKETQWSVSIDAASSQYTPISATPALKNLNFGLFDDSFLHENHSENDNEYNRASWLFFGEDRSNSNVAGGELNYYSQYDQEHVLDVGTGPWGTSYEELSSLYHISYMIGNDQLSHQTAARIEEAGMANGYQFEVLSFESNGIESKVWIKNKGIAPIYYEAYPELHGTRSNQSLRGLAPGDSAEFTIATPAFGEDLEIVCDRLVAGQEIQFIAGIEGNVAGTNELFDLPSISPNPVTEVLHVTNHSGSSFEIHDTQGRVLQTGNIESNDQQVSVAGIPAGSFVITFNGRSSVQFLKK